MCHATYDLLQRDFCPIRGDKAVWRDGQALHARAQQNVELWVVQRQPANLIDRDLLAMNRVRFRKHVFGGGDAVDCPCKIHRGRPRMAHAFGGGGGRR